MSSSYAPGNGIHDTTGGKAPSKAPVAVSPKPVVITGPRAKPFRAPTTPNSEVVPLGTKPRQQPVRTEMVPTRYGGLVRYVYRDSTPKKNSQADVAFHQIVQAVGPKVIARAANPRVATLQHVLGDVSGIPPVVDALRTHQHLGSAAVSVAGFLPFGRAGKAAEELAKLAGAAKGVEAGAKAAPPVVRTVEMTERQAAHRLARLDRQYEAAVEKLKPVVHPYTPEQVAAETRGRNTMRGRMDAGKKPATGKTVEGRVGGGSKTIKTVDQEVHDLAEAKLHELIARYPDNPLAKKAAAVIAERQHLQDILNRRGEAAITGDVAPALPHIDLPAPPKLERGARAQGSLLPTQPRPKMSQVPKGEATLETGGDLGRQVREGLKSARFMRSQQERIYAAERGKRAAEFEARMKADPTIAGYRAATGALKGELPKLQFKGFEQFDQDALDALAKHVINHPLLQTFEKGNTIQALVQISGGKVPTRGQIKLLRKVFGRETSADLVRSVSTWQKWKERGLDALNIPRSIMASFDVSAPFRQGLVVAVTHPAIFAKNFAPMFKSFGSERFYQETLAEIHSRPTYPAMEQAGVSFTELGSKLNQREEQFVSSLAERLTGGKKSPIRMSGRAYTAFLDKTRADVFDFLLEKAVEGGRSAEDQKLIEGIAGFVNSATGRGSLGALQGHAVTLNTLMFSPRLLASRLNFMNPVWYAHLDPFARKEALKAARNLVATMGLVMFVAKLAGAQVGDDPRSADFAKIKIGDTRIDLAGGFQQLVRLIAQEATGQTISTTSGDILHLGAAGPGKVSRFDIAMRFARSKSAPVPSALWDLSTQQTFTGSPLTWKNQLLPRVTPLAGQDAYDTGRNYHSIPAGIGAYAGSAIGVGVQTYKPRAKKATAGNSGGSVYAPSSGGTGSIYAP